METINNLVPTTTGTEIAQDLGFGFIAKNAALNGAMNLGIKALQIAFTLFLCWLMIRLSHKLINKVLEAQVQRKKLAMSERKASTLSTVAGSILKYVIYFIGLVSVLKQLGVPTESLLVIASAGSVAIGLGAQGIAGDMMEGFFILFEDHYAVGDVVTIQGITGTVESVTLRSTKLRDGMGAVHIIPNGSIGTVTNNCREFIKAAVTVGVAYGENIDNAIAVLNDEMAKTTDMEDILETPVVAGVVALDASEVTLKVVATCKVKTAAGVEAELRRRIKNRFDAEGIEIPFPQQVVHLVKEA
ncbi:MAG: mechanosensitive ion channel family protein [Anaerotignum sp.]|nr:mechanosensitive ion channel family protein [Anaerotignum sp.]